MLVAVFLDELFPAFLTNKRFAWLAIRIPAPIVLLLSSSLALWVIACLGCRVIKCFPAELAVALFWQLALIWLPALGVCLSMGISTIPTTKGCAILGLGPELFAAMLANASSFPALPIMPGRRAVYRAEPLLFPILGLWLELFTALFTVFHVHNLSVVSLTFRLCQAGRVSAFR